MPPVKFLICGSGGAGLHCAHVAAADGRGEIVGLFDPVGAQLEEALDKYPNAAAGANYEKLLDETNPDVVVVAGPDHLHAEQTITALEHGCHALVEKPFATSVADARRMIEVEERTGLHVMTDQTMRYVYPWREMVLATKAGEIGEPFFIQGDYIHDMTAWYRPQGRHHTPWRIDSENPQNILLGGGIHPIDLMLWAVDSPVEEVSMYSSARCVPEFPSEDCYILIMRFANGVLGKCHVTSGCAGPTWHGFFESYGLTGTLKEGSLYRRDEEPVALEDTSTGNVVGGHGWAGSVVAFLDLLEGKAENPITSKAGANNVAVCEAGLISAQTGRSEKVEWFY